GMGLFSIILAVWVYNDSTNLNMANASLWAVVVLFTSLLGVIIYVLSKPVNPYSIANNRINTSVNQSSNKVATENKYSNTKYFYCSSCGTKNEFGSKFCENCGATIN
ncbi:MAG: zinc-ribbon domain-containing protein, partial [Candidatus Hodarchaeales archaeon]